MLSDESLPEVGKNKKAKAAAAASGGAAAAARGKTSQVRKPFFFERRTFFPRTNQKSIRDFCLLLLRPSEFIFRLLRLSVEFRVAGGLHPTHSRYESIGVLTYI